ncbi:MAG: hypothetical protein EOP51_35245 [Sphingobacteriales bacterium]|nr:MAG: hypothetical protein EOP51_35245 [Sphingobacteriales bacterium]
MLPLLTSAHIREADAFTIANEPIASVDLMERAAKAFVGWFINHFPGKDKAITVYALLTRPRPILTATCSVCSKPL